MMKQEDKQLLLKELCARLLYGVKFTLSSNNTYTIKGIDLIVTDEGVWEYAVTATGIEPIEIEYIKPYLRPMSSMTRDEVEELKSKCIHTETDEDWEDVSCDSWGIEILYKYDTRNRYNPIEAVSDVDMDAIDWLNAHHFDYRNLIERGLALPAPEGMYKF